MKTFFFAAISTVLLLTFQATPFAAEGKDFAKAYADDKNWPACVETWVLSRSTILGQSNLFVLVALLLSFGAAGAENRNEPEWKGMFQYSGEYNFNVRPPGSNSSLWLKIGDLRQGLHIIAYDANGKTLQIEYHGERKHLRLAEPDGRPLPVQASRNVSVAQAKAPNQAPKERRALRRQTVAALAAERSEKPSRARLRSIRLDKSSADEPIISDRTMAREASVRTTAQQPSANRNARRLPRQKDEADGG